MGGVDEPTGGGADGAEPLRLVEPHGARRPPGAADALPWDDAHPVPPGHAGPMKTLGAVLLRIVVTAVLAVLAGWDTAVAGAGASDDGLGAGLVAFAALALVALVWSFLDARSGRSVFWVLLVWAVVGLVLGALGALQAQGLDGPLDRGILLDDLKGLPLMGGLLTLVPALVGAMVGWVIRGLGGSGR